MGAYSLMTFTYFQFNFCQIRTQTQIKPESLYFLLLYNLSHFRGPEAVLCTNGSLPWRDKTLKDGLKRNGKKTKKLKYICIKHLMIYDYGDLLSVPLRNTSPCHVTVETD